MIALSEESHLLQMRGLKRETDAKVNLSEASHLLQMRGLKPLTMLLKCPDWVASFTDAWIETGHTVTTVNTAMSHLLQMRGLKLKLGLVQLISTRRIFYRCVD